MTMPGFTAEAALGQAAQYRRITTSGPKGSRAVSAVGEPGTVQLQGIMSGLDFQIARCLPRFEIVYVVCGTVEGPQGVSPLYCPKIEFLGFVCS